MKRPTSTSHLDSESKTVKYDYEELLCTFALSLCSQGDYYGVYWRLASLSHRLNDTCKKQAFPFSSRHYSIIKIIKRTFTEHCPCGDITISPHCWEDLLAVCTAFFQLSKTLYCCGNSVLGDQFSRVISLLGGVVRDFYWREPKFYGAAVRLSPCQLDPELFNSSWTFPDIELKEIGRPKIVDSIWSRYLRVPSLRIAFTYNGHKSPAEYMR